MTIKIKKNRSIASDLLFYWVILVLWQNIGKMQLRSTADMFIKIGLFAYLSVSFLKRSHKIGRNAVKIILLSGSLLVTLITKEGLSLGVVISYVFPILFLLLIYGVGDRFEISKEQLLSFCHTVIIVTLYAAVYSMIFCTDQLMGALSASMAYGHEVSSFFISSHEYGMYLAAGIISCVICLKYGQQGKKKYYVLAATILVANLVFTFSRTSIFSTIIFFATYVCFENGKIKKCIVAIGIAFLIIMIFSPDVSEFVFRMVLKENKLGSRERLFQNAITYYQTGSVFEKIFGHGITNTRYIFTDRFGHGSVHNAYLQILLYYGAIGVSCLIAFLSSQFLSCWKLVQKDRFMGVVSMGLLFMAGSMMFTDTTVLFSSSIDSYFLTVYFIVVPKYVRNSINSQGIKKWDMCSM